jgi:beta-mannosidase
VATVTATDGSIVSTHPVLYAPPKQMALPKAHVKYTLSGTTIAVSTDAVALFVTFTTLAQGRFSDNAFLLLPGEPRKIEFLPFEGFDEAELRASLRVEHVATYTA